MSYKFQIFNRIDNFNQSFNITQKFLAKEELMFNRKPPTTKFIATTKDGVICNPNEAIFPILKQLDYDNWQLIGTGFFITKYGIFLTAKHVLKDVFDDNTGKQTHPIVGFIFPSPTIYQIRRVLKGFLNVPGDVAAGLLDMTNSLGKPLGNPFYGIDRTPVKVGEKIHTFAYPKTKCEVNKIAFRADYYEGKIVEHFPNGRDHLMLPNPCYQTDMDILHGASGGPVFNSTGRVIGINSSAYNLDNGEPPISFISDISEAFKIVLGKIKLPCGYKEKCTIEELHTLGYVSTNALNTEYKHCDVII